MCDDDDDSQISQTSERLGDRQETPLKRDSEAMIKQSKWRTTNTTLFVRH